MSTGGKTVYAWTAQNDALVNFQPGQLLMLDVANSSNGLAAKLTTGAGIPPLGICIDKAKLDPVTGVVDQVQSIAFVDIGREWAIASGVVNPGDKVAASATPGQVAAVVRAIAGAVPVPIVGTAETPTTGAGQGVLVRLEIGGTW